MWQHSNEGISVKDLVVAAAIIQDEDCNRRFSTILSDALPGQELQRIRIERAKTLLASSNWLQNGIAWQHVRLIKNANSFRVRQNSSMLTECHLNSFEIPSFIKRVEKFYQAVWPITFMSYTEC